MTHIHIPDGVLPLWLWALGWAVTLAAVTLTGRLAARDEARRKVPLIGVVAALMIVGMSAEIVPIAYHVNLAVIGGILLGPRLSVIAAFIVVLVLALLGHGGITVLGLNTIVIGAEMLLGWALFQGAMNVLGKKRAALGAASSTVLALATTTALVVGIVWIGGAGEATARETGALDPATLRFESPWEHGVLKMGLFGAGHEDEEGNAEEAASPAVEAEEHAEEDSGRYLSAERFAAVVFTLGPLGWLIEALVTAGVIGYTARVRPALVFAGPLARQNGRRIPGDESGGH
ncbi:MAG: energy-coupling factor ABC transporter permease [Clostridiales bacterium]|nr:energy-coupling factor ABC transporter permease [Clostridiales bacterium]